PASESMPTRPLTTRFAAATKTLPGPVTTSTGSRPIDGTPCAKAAIAPAPPIAYTSVTPHSAAAQSTAGCGRPSLSLCAGDASARLGTPAVWAATAFMMTEDGYAALRPGA